MPAPHDFGRTKKKEQFQDDFGKESKGILIIEFKVHSGGGRTWQTGSVPELPQKNTSSQDCSEMWMELHKTITTFSWWHVQKKDRGKSGRKLHGKRSRENREGGRKRM